jgi:hypothetical protein
MMEYPLVKKKNKTLCELENHHVSSGIKIMFIIHKWVSFHSYVK